MTGWTIYHMQSNIQSICHIHVRRTIQLSLYIYHVPYTYTPYHIQYTAYIYHMTCTTQNTMQYVTISQFNIPSAIHQAVHGKYTISYTIYNTVSKFIHHTICHIRRARYNIWYIIIQVKTILRFIYHTIEYQHTIPYATCQMPSNIQFIIYHIPYTICLQKNIQRENIPQATYNNTSIYHNIHQTLYQTIFHIPYAYAR